LKRGYRDAEVYLDDNKETLAQFHLKVPGHNTIWKAMKFVPEDYLKRLNHSARKRNIVIVRSQGSKTWKNMLLEYAEKPDDWNKIYHFRSSTETAFSAIKRKFGYQRARYLETEHAQGQNLYWDL
jgi:hypothetical protein